MLYEVNKKFGAMLPLDEVEEFQVSFGSKEPNPKFQGPGGTPYVAYLVIPRYIWESAGEPKEWLCQITAGPFDEMPEPEYPGVFMIPVYA